ncbi:ABC transporter ATP-binding protein [Halobaculum limi]|uniref:ABC transporter ATP-binding protein n=1 Tax=Halobaculum limi TaxID=3031916 RepID=UPI0024075CA3|nr:ABC transporter ATP-binding protein [Halobaculum sp. YSMS11]
MTDGGVGDTADPRAENTAATLSTHQQSASGSTGATAETNATGRERTTAVSVEGIRKQFGEGDDAVTAVDGVSFDLAQGSVTGVLGPNGAGKTTLIKCILGMVLPDEGRVELLGHDVLEDPRSAYTHVDAMLEGARNDYWRLTVRENLRYFTTISGVDPDSVADRHERILRQLDLTEKADTPVRDLSRGMKQKVSLASVLAGGAEVVFLDEPTLGLDVESSRTLQRELRRLVEEEDLTVVLSSHDMDVIETVCDRVIIMSDGRIVADDTVEALLRGGDVHAVQITSSDFDESLVTAVRKRVDLRSIESVDDGDATRIEAAVDSDGLYELLAFLREEGVTLRAVRTVEPDLEDVFVSLTGLDGGER